MKCLVLSSIHLGSISRPGIIATVQKRFRNLVHPVLNLFICSAAAFVGMVFVDSLYMRWNLQSM
jgi:hypothetical protein